MRLHTSNAVIRDKHRGPKTGAIIMGAFALGTAPALLGIGGLSSIMKGTVARVFYATVGVLVIVFGIYNIKSGAAVLPFSLTSNTPADGTEDVDIDPTNVQTLTMTQGASGYTPSELRVKVGVPVRWVITSESSFTCASNIIVPSLGINKNLKKGENIITFTPTKKATFPSPVPWACIAEQ